MNPLLPTVIRSLDRLFNGIAVLAGFAILLAVSLTFTDVLMRVAGQLAALDSGVRKPWGVTGLIDLTQLAILTAAALSIAFGFWRCSHVYVDILTEHFSPTRQRLAQATSGLLAAALMFGCFWFGLAEMRRQLDFPTTSATLGIPFTWYWLPLLAGLLLAAFAALVRSLGPFFSETFAVKLPGQSPEKLLNPDSRSGDQNHG